MVSPWFHSQSRETKKREYKSRKEVGEAVKRITKRRGMDKERNRYW